MEIFIYVHQDVTGGNYMVRNEVMKLTIYFRSGGILTCTYFLN